MDAGQIVRRHPAFSKLDAATLDGLIRVSTVQRLRRGEALWKANERANALVVVGHGLIKSLLPSTGAREQSLGLYGPGESVGDAAMLEGTTYGTLAIALTDSVIVARIPRDHIVPALERNGAAGIEFARSVGRAGAAANRRVALFTASAEERLAATIIELGERFGDEMEDGSTMIPVRMTRAEIAALIGTTVETTIRTLSRWSREGIVSTVDGGLTVHDPSALARRSAPGIPFAQPVVLAEPVQRAS